MTSIRAARFNWAPVYTAVKVPSSADANVADDAMTQCNVKATGHVGKLRRDLSV